jgi:hypothetical protein
MKDSESIEFWILPFVRIYANCEWLIFHNELVYVAGSVPLCCGRHAPVHLFRQHAQALPGLLLFNPHTALLLCETIQIKILLLAFLRLKILSGQIRSAVECLQMQCCGSGSGIRDWVPF